MPTELIHVGFGNVLAANRIVAVVSPHSAPTRRLIQECRNKGTMIDMTSGRRMKSVVITDNGCVILAALSADTIIKRVQALGRGIIKD